MVGSLRESQRFKTTRRIALESESALTELVLHLAGPAKDFYSDLTSEEKDTLENVKQSW